MTDYREIAEEARRRAGKIRARDKRIKKAVIFCVPIVLCISILSAVMIPRPDIISGGGDSLYTAPGHTANITSPAGAVNVTSPAGYTQVFGADYMLASPQYPERVKYPMEEDYLSDGDHNWESNGYNDAVDAWFNDLPQRAKCTVSAKSFFTASARQLLCGAGQENRVYSPLNIFMALGMLAETSGGRSREQILDLLGVSSIEQLRAEASAVWNADYQDDGVTTSRLANSVWLSNDLSYNPDALNSLSENYYASSFGGKMGDPAYSSVFREWLDEQTDGLLSDFTGKAEFDVDDVMVLAQTILYKSTWIEEFEKYNTKEGVFHGAGGDTQCSFMRDSSISNYYYGENFAAINRPLDSGGKMWFILPNEGSSTDDVLQSDAMAAFFAGEKWAESREATILSSIPKFDASSEFDLEDGLKKLGITDIFNPRTADFSPAFSGSDIYVGDIQHAARVMIDEEGFTGAAFTISKIIPMCHIERDNVEFTLNRPFIFVVTDSSDLPLFAGVINCIE